MNNVFLLQSFQLSKKYYENGFCTEVLRNVNFTLQKGEMTAIIGSSGSGKSTLLHLLGGLDEPSNGEVIFEGQSFNKLSHTERARVRNQRLGFIYQFHHLLPDFTVLENVAMPMLIGNMNSSQAHELAFKMLLSVGLQRHCYYRPSDLSGGERQRVAIARALVNNPSLVLADEPTGNLDQKNANIIFELLNELNIRIGTSFLVVTHDLQLSKKLHRQLEMHDGTLQEKKFC